MIDTHIKIDKAAMRHMESIITGFAKATGKTAEDGVKRMVKSACVRLASTVHPYGLLAGKGGNGHKLLNKFSKNLALQVGQAWFGTNIGVYPATTSMAEAHRNARNPNTGRVHGRRFRKEKGKPWLFLIPESEKNAHIKKVQAKAFRAKAGWLKCSKLIDGKHASGVPSFIKKHVDSGRGSVSVIGKGLDTRIKFSNDVPYIKKIQYTEDIQQSIQEGMVNGLKYMATTTKKAIEKANRDLK